MGSRKVNTEGIDEELLIASIGRRRQDGTLYHAQEPPAPAPEEESVPETEPPPVQYTAKEKPLQGEVLAVGNGTKDEGHRPPQTAGGRLFRAVPPPQRDKDTPVRLYQPRRPQQDSQNRERHRRA